MNMTSLHWWLHTDAGLFARISLGASIFTILAIADFTKHGRAASRWKEYAFLLCACFVAMLYGAINDQVTSRISWEYFYYGKELSQILGDRIPPDPAALHWEAAKVGIKATWSMGLIAGVAMLVANNPRKQKPQLSYPQLISLLPMILLITSFCAIIGGLLGYYGCLTWMQTDFREMTQTNLWHPRRFIATWSIHLGGYVGGLLGTGLAVWNILRHRRRDGNIDHGEA